jgi:hypothetical protein
MFLLSFFEILVGVQKLLDFFLDRAFFGKAMATKESTGLLSGI